MPRTEVVARNQLGICVRFLSTDAASADRHDGRWRRLLVRVHRQRRDDAIGTGVLPQGLGRELHHRYTATVVVWFGSPQCLFVLRCMLRQLASCSVESGVRMSKHVTKSSVDSGVRVLLTGGRRRSQRPGDRNAALPAGDRSSVAWLRLRWRQGPHHAARLRR